MSDTWEWKQKLSKEIFFMKYDLHNEGNVHTIFDNIATEIASCEKKNIRKDIQQDFLNIMMDKKFIPAGRILANARPNSKMKNYNNCFTIGLEDSMEGIYNSLLEDAQISKMGGGVGFNVSDLRPKDAVISKGGESSGPISFLEVFDASAKTIHTGGGRRSAHIAVMNVDHPDIEEFITVKQGDHNKKLTQFNISVGITDAFIKAVKEEADWDLVFEGKIYKTVKAVDLYNLLNKNAFTHNEPGIFNLDHVNDEANSYYMYYIQQVNPCGEQSLPPYGVCDLGALNLSRFIKDAFSKIAKVDWDDLKRVIKHGVRFLDNVLTVTDYPLKKIEERSLSERRIGLGFTGYADMMAKLRIVYGSEESKVFTDKLGKFFRDAAYEASIELAQEKGSFPECDNALIGKSKFIKRLPKNLRDGISEHGLRNVAMLTVAPTGTTSLSLGQNCSSGIEPMFSLSYTRNYRTGNGDETNSELVYDDAWLDWLEFDATLVDKAKDLLVGNDLEVPPYFVTTVDIDPKDTIDLQAIWQKYIDASISKTLNLKPGTTYEEYSELFMYAYDKGLKGFTSFNPDGSLKGILEYNEPSKSTEEYITRTEAPKRPDELECDIHEITVQGKKFIILVGKLYGSLYEIFLDSNDDGAIDVNHHKAGIIKKSGKGKYSLIIKNGVDRVVIENLAMAFDATYGVLARFISMGLRHGTPLQFIVDQLNRSKHFLGFERAVSRVLKKYIKEGEVVQTGDVCPECEGTLEYRDGCMTCGNCGWSKCS